VAGLNPNSPTSQFRILITRQPDKTNYVLNWNTSTGRVYTIWQKTNLAGKFVAVPGASNLPYSTQKFTNSFNPSVPVLFYRVEVRKP
jgi:hypothetical protein